LRIVKEKRHWKSFKGSVVLHAWFMTSKQRMIVSLMLTEEDK